MRIVRVCLDDNIRARTTTIRSYPINIQEGSIFEMRYNGKWIAVRVVKVRTTLFSEVYIVEKVPS